MNYVLGISASVVFLAALAVALWLRRRRLAALPKGWTQTGPAPEGADVVLSILLANAPGPIPKSGRVRWVEAPFLFGGRLVAGVCASVDPMDVAALTGPRVERTPLIHEVGHGLWYLAFGWSGQINHPDGTVTLDPAFVRWTEAMEAMSAAALAERRGG